MCLSRLKLFLAISFSFLALMLPSWSADFYVDAVNGNNAYDGQAAVWDGVHGPKKTIKAMLPGIPGGSIIHVASGTYDGTLGETFPITLTNQTLLGADSATCIIEGASCDTNLFSLGNTASLSNLSIIFKSPNNNDKAINVTGASVTISNNIIRQAGATSLVGWGMDFTPGSSGTVSGNTITNFIAGIYTNTANDILVEKNTIQAKNNCIHYNNSGTLTARGNILMATPSLDKLVVIGSGNGLNYDGSGTLDHSYNCYFNNKDNYEGGITAGTGDIYQYPRFVAPWDNDFRLYSDSPCIGAWSGANIGADQTSGLAGSPYVSIIYVSGSGSDTIGDGTQANPFRTIAMGQRYALEKVVLMSGSYAPTDIIMIGDGRTISGVGREDVIIESAINPLALMQNNTRLEGCTLKGTYPGPLPYPMIWIRKSVQAALNDCAFYMTGTATLSVCVFNHFATAEVSDCLVSGGTGGIYAYASSSDTPVIRRSLHIEGCTIVDFDAYGVGNDSDTVYVKDCIISAAPGGSPPAGTYGTWNYSATQGAISVTYSDVYNNETSYYQTTTGSGTIASDAKFVNAAGGNYNLEPTSPCIDTGDPALTDPDGTRKDMGAYAFYQTPSTSSTTTTTTTVTTTTGRPLTITRASSGRGAYLSYNFNAAQAEPITILIEEPGPPKKVVLEHNFTSQAGNNTGTLPFLRFGVKPLPAGVYNYRIIFRSSKQVVQGKILHKPGIQ
ncbi:MAG: DUF1565 domain-containing protein [Candidatus Saganbacteria bacterium]|nr:DUF1565 domain-containing protein [Candidatus Saganbacteria bacterium]